MSYNVFVKGELTLTGFELGSPCPIPTSIITTLRTPAQPHNGSSRLNTSYHQTTKYFQRVQFILPETDPEVT